MKARLKVKAEKATWEAQQAAMLAARKDGEARDSQREAEEARSSAAAQRDIGNLQEAAALGSAALKLGRAAAMAKDEAAELLAVSQLKVQNDYCLNKYGKFFSFAMFTNGMLFTNGTHLLCKWYFSLT